MNRVAIIITNYNMPERADALADYITKYMNPDMYDIYLVDNGSDQMPPARNTTVRLNRNLQTCNGWIQGLDEAACAVYYNRTEPYLAYWIMITSAEFVGGGDILTPMVDYLAKHDNAVLIHPALTKDSTTAWKHLLARGGDKPRRTWMVDNIAALYRAEWFDKINWFDPALTYAWGTDLESCYLARLAGRSIWVDERVQMKKVTNIGYTMNRMGESAADRARNAYEESARVLSGRYGPDWEKELRGRYVLKEWL